MALGLAVAAFGNQASASSLVAGGILVVVGAGGVALGTVRYRRVSREIEAGRFATGSSGATAVAASIVLVGAVLVALLLLAVDR